MNILTTRTVQNFSEFSNPFGHLINAGHEGY